MLEINSSLIIQIVNFLLLLFLLNVLVYRPIRRILNRRNEEMSSLQKSIEDFQRKYLRYSEDFRESSIGAKRDGYKEKEGLKASGLEEEKRLLQETSAAAEQKRAKAAEELRAKLAEVRQSLQVEIDGFSKELSEKILGRSI